MMTPMWRWLLLSLFPVLSLADARVPRRPLLHDAYIWQRQWNGNVAAAMQQSADFVRVWRVLAAMSDARGHLQAVTVNWLALAGSGRAVVPVIRIEGQLARWDHDTLSEEIHGVLKRWQDQQLPIAGVEIDYDCATVRLPAYAELLVRLRVQIDPAIPLSITALPTWVLSPSLKDVLKQVDEVVLQVHAVQNPRAGLFDPRQVRQWVDAWSRQSVTPFRIALPTYGSRVSWRTDGSLLSVESEAPLLAGGYGAVELMASPVEVATFLRGLEDEPLPHVAGVVWFRLPTADDRRAWSIETWRAVISGQPLSAYVEVLANDSDTPGMRNLLLVNRGEVDVELPQRIDLPDTCTLADGINGYALGRGDTGLFLQRVRGGLLHSHRQQLIGWMRGPSQGKEIHVRP